MHNPSFPCPTAPHTIFISYIPTAHPPRAHTSNPSSIHTRNIRYKHKFFFPSSGSLSLVPGYFFPRSSLNWKNVKVGKKKGGDGGISLGRCREMAHCAAIEWRRQRIRAEIYSSNGKYSRISEEMMVFFFLGGLGIEKMMLRFGDRVGIAWWGYEGRRGRKGGRGKRGGEGGGKEWDGGSQGRKRCEKKKKMKSRKR